MATMGALRARCRHSSRTMDQEHDGFEQEAQTLEERDEKLAQHMLEPALACHDRAVGLWNWLEGCEDDRGRRRSHAGLSESTQPEVQIVNAVSAPGRFGVCSKLILFCRREDGVDGGRKTTD